MTAYQLNNEKAQEKVMTLLNLSCQYKITNKLIDEVI